MGSARQSQLELPPRTPHPATMCLAVALAYACLAATLARQPPGVAGAVSTSLSVAAIGSSASSAELLGLGQEMIVGGKSTSIIMYPYMVSVEKYFEFVPRWFHNCGGTVINQYNILSAAHCIFEEPHAAYRVRAGSSTRGTGGKVVSVAKVFYHPKFTATAIDYDVGIYRLKSSLTYSFGIQPVRLPKVGDVPKAGTKVQIIGWGAKTSMAFEYPTHLQRAQVSVVNQTACAQDYKGTRAVSRRMVCAAAPGKDSCTGDSGGPLLSVAKSRKDVVVQYGVTSWGDLCADRAHPGVYCSLADAEIREYIDKTLKSRD